MSRSSDQPHPPPDDLAIPPRLAEELSSLFPAPHVPARVDAAVLNAARAHLAGAGRGARILRHRRLLRWVGAGAAVAAAAMVVVGVRVHQAGHAHFANTPGVAIGTSPAPPPPAVAGDVDGNGRIDILDAFTVARALADKSRTGPLPAAWDVNGDGVVDQKDVDWLATAAVRVGGVARGEPGGAGDVLRLAEKLGALEVGALKDKRIAMKAIGSAKDGALPAATGRPDFSPGNAEEGRATKGAAAQ